MTADDITTAIASAATANGITTQQQLAALLAGSFATSLAIHQSGVTVQQLTDLLVKGQLPAKVADLQKQIRAKEAELAEATAAKRAEIQALNEQIADLQNPS